MLHGDSGARALTSWWRQGRWMMVAVQGLIFLAVAVTAVMPVPGERWPALLWWSLILIIVGGVGVLWTGRSLGAALTPSPVPNGEGLAASGLYRWARHPMYTCLTLICLGIAMGSGAWTCYLSVVALVVFFHVKSSVEERYLRATYEGYREYAARTGRFLPGVGRDRI